MAQVRTLLPVRPRSPAAQPSAAHTLQVACLPRARRKVPRDLTEATLAGGTISLISSLVMAYLFITNFSLYLQIDTVTSVRLDESQEKKIQINFNVTLHHLPCRFTSVDIADVMGTHLQVACPAPHRTIAAGRGGARRAT